MSAKITLYPTAHRPIRFEGKLEVTEGEQFIIGKSTLATAWYVVSLYSTNSEFEPWVVQVEFHNTRRAISPEVSVHSGDIDSVAKWLEEFSVYDNEERTRRNTASNRSLDALPSQWVMLLNKLFTYPEFTIDL